jgi:CubicO group peptidase (beta-lactamase class C family)
MPRARSAKNVPSPKGRELSAALRWIPIHLLWAACLSIATLAQADSRLADIDAFVDTQRALYFAPGVSLIIVADGKVVHAKGYGFRNVERNLPMTEHTVVPIASVTKSFTVASLAALVREGKVAWDQPVRNYLSHFRMDSDYATLNVTLRDLVTHRTGLPRHDWSWFTADVNRDELVRRIAHLPLTAEPRARWQYNNFMYMTAGYVGGKVAGTEWEALVQTRLLAPLGMQATSFTLDSLRQQADHGTGYTLDENKRAQPVAYRALTAMGPTGSMNASTSDMGRYLTMLDAGGLFEGKRILETHDIQDMMTPHMVIPDPRLYSELGPTQYGMGYFLTHYRGERYVHHGGNMPGASSLMSFLPQKRLAVFVHTNVSGSSLPSAIAYGVFDRWLKQAPIDWGLRFREREASLQASEAAARTQNLSPQRQGTQPAHPMPDYAGRYENPGYGVAEFSTAGNATLQLKFNALTTTFQHYHFDVFAVPANKLDPMEKLKAQFHTSLDGEVSTVAIGFEAETSPITFRRLPDAALKDPKVLAQLVGTYQMGPSRVMIAARPDDVLTMSVAGRPRELEPLRQRGRTLRYAMKGLSNSFVEFTLDGKGAAEQAVFYQPSGNFVAPRIAE